MPSFNKELTDSLLQGGIPFGVNMGSKYQPNFRARFSEVALLFVAAGRDHPERKVGIVSAKRQFDSRRKFNGFNQFVELGLGEAVNLKLL